MPRRKSDPISQEGYASNNEDWWLATLKNIYGLDVKRLQTSGYETVRTEEGTFNVSKWELQTIKDPLFEKFLRYGPGRTNIGPKTISAFLSLPENEKKFYIEVFKEWKQVIKEKNLPIEQLE